jgi:streptomycin 6-kinase
MTLEEIMIGPLGVLGDRLIVTKNVLANLREDAVVEEAERVSRMMMHEVWM